MKRFAPTLAGVALCLLALPAKSLLENRLAEKKKSRNIAVAPTEASYHGRALKRYDAGFHQMLAGLIWIRLLQDASYAPLESDQVSWEYTELDAITTLDPFARPAYNYGQAFLSVFRRDKLGAKMLLGKWVKREPNNWRAHYLYGFHLYFEMDDYAAAAEEIIKAASLEGAPTWISSLGVRLLEQGLAYEQALKQAVELLPLTEHPHGRDRLIGRIRALNLAVQKKIWNDALAAFRREKKREPHGIEELAPYRGDAARTLATMLQGTTVDASTADILRESFRFKYDTAAKGIVAADSAVTKSLEKLGVYKP